MRPIVISLFDRTGIAVRPWRKAGWECWVVDIQHKPGIGQWDNGVVTVGADVRTWQLPPDVYPCFVSAFPPCTHLAISGAAHFQAKGIRSVIDGLELVAAGLETISRFTCPYYVENPVGILSTHWRKPDYIFHPWEFARYLDMPSMDAYSKRTCLWTGNGFVMPKKKPVKSFCKKRIHYAGPKDRMNNRSETPEGFATAVYLANRKVAASQLRG